MSMNSVNAGLDGSMYWPIHEVQNLPLEKLIQCGFLILVTLFSVVTNGMFLIDQRYDDKMRFQSGGFKSVGICR